MRARISGRAGAFAIQRGEAWEVGRRGRSVRETVSELDATRILGWTPDVIELELKTVSDAEKRLEVEWSKDRALRLFLLLLDPSESLAGLDAVPPLLERLLGNPHVADYIKDQFSQQELPNEVEWDRATRLVDGHENCAKLIACIDAWRGNISLVSQSFDTLPDNLFAGSLSKPDYREAAVAAGAFRALVDANDGGKLSDAAIFNLHGKMRRLPDARRIVQAWVSSFERVSIELPPLPSDIEDEYQDDVREFGGGPGGNQQLRNALEQQAAILERVADGDYETARRFAADLIRSQLSYGGAAYLCKSLTRLSARAREMEAYELALDWAREAVDVQPDDARARTQYADALLQADNFEGALAQFIRAGELGERGYAATGQARILRRLGRFDEASQQFEEAGKAFAGTDDSIHALAGLAGVKRDMGDLQGALAETQALVAQFPHSHVAHMHHATVLTRLGKFADAWTELEEAGKYTKEKVLVLNGFARICRITGRLDEARRRFSEITNNYPRDVGAHIGLIDTLRQLGELQNASMLARRVAERFPGSPRAVARSAETASELGRHIIARQILAEASVRFPRDSRIVVIRAAALRREGRYDSALSALDAAIAKLPYNLHLQRARAEMLRRSGNLDAAEQVYRLLLDADQGDVRSRNGLASIMILQGRLALAGDLVGGDNPITADEWRSFFIKADLFDRSGDVAAAGQRFSWALANCPFAYEHRLFSCAIAKHLIEIGRPRQAPRIAVTAEADIGNLINFQVLAMTSKSRAKAAYASLGRHLPRRYEKIKEEIARSYGVADGKAANGKGWLLRQINDELLLVAA